MAAQAMAGLTIDPFDCESGSTALPEQWREWFRAFELAMVAFGINDPARQRAMLLHFAGKAVIQIESTLDTALRNPEDGPAENVYTATVRALTDYFAPANNTDYNKWVFRQAKQGTEETIDQFYVRLKKLAVGCGFVNDAAVTEEIRTQIIHKCRSTNLRERSLRSIPPMTLNQLLERERLSERAKIQTENMEADAPSGSGSVNRIARYREVLDNDRQSIKSRLGRKRSYDSRDPGGASYQQRGKKCNFCGNEFHENGLNDCPARGKQCYQCDKFNHFAKCCIKSTYRGRTRSQSSPRRSEYRDQSHQQKKSENRSNGRRHFKGRTAVLDGEEESHSETESEEGELYALDSGNKQPRITVLINNSIVNLLVDTGSSVTIIDQLTYQSIKAPELKSTKMKIRAFKEVDPIKIEGVFEATISSLKHKDRRVKEKIYVTSDQKRSSGGTCVLSYQAAKELKFVRMSEEVTHAQVNSVAVQPLSSGLIKSSKSKSSNQKNGHQQTQEMQPDGSGKSVGIRPIGKIKNILIKLHIDTSVRAVAQPHRRVAHPFRELVEKQIHEHLQNDIIEPAVGPTPWINNVLFVKKPPPAPPGSYRLCIDMRQANKAIMRERHLIPTVDDLLAAVCDAKWFSVIDLNQAYHQLELHPESRYITTFSTHIGLFRYKRLFFGLNAAPEIFHNVLRSIISDLKGVLNCSDDILVWGRTKKEHDENLTALRKRLEEMNVTMNQKKDQIGLQEVDFHGMEWTDHGLEIDKKKVEAIQKFPEPTCETEVRSLLGMANYCARFIKGYSDMTAPLRQLTTKSRVGWNWSQQCQIAFETLKKALINVPSLAYFSNDRQTELVVDASPIGLGAILCQIGERKVFIIAFASKALTATEQRYSQLEREALAIIWGCEHFQLYLLGSSFVVWTDHKPLVSLFNNPAAKLSLRLERWMLRKQAFDMKVVYLPGEWNAADYLSRHPVSKEKNAKLTLAGERYVNFITSGVIEAVKAPIPFSERQISEETKKDDELQQVIEALDSGKWYKLKQKLQCVYSHISTELSLTSSGILMRGQRVCVPKSLQEEIVKLAHEGHQGITRTKQLLRMYVWFPGMDKLAEMTVQQCIPCQVATKSKKRAPLQMTKLPERPWQKVSADFYTFPTAKELLVLIDNYSRFPIVEEVASTSHKQVIPKLENVISTFGIPEELTSDNGPPFNGKPFQEFCSEMGIVHRKVTPLWPEANGCVERFMKTLGKVIRTAAAERKPWQQAVVTFLRNYRATPHPATGRSPAEVLFNQQTRNKMPDLRHSDELYKQRLKEYADSKRRVAEHELKVGDEVFLMKTKKLLNKTEPQYEMDPYTVTEVKGTMITARNSSKSVTRNCSLFKKKKEKTIWLPMGDTEQQQEENRREEEMVLEPQEIVLQVPEQRERPARRGPRSNQMANGPVRTSGRRQANLPDRYNNEDFIVRQFGKRR